MVPMPRAIHAPVGSDVSIHPVNPATTNLCIAAIGGWSLQKIASGFRRLGNADSKSRLSAMPRALAAGEGKSSDHAPKRGVRTGSAVDQAATPGNLIRGSERAGRQGTLLGK
jgi:hypothetical protein